jgi:hypothetical protein
MFLRTVGPVSGWLIQRKVTVFEKLQVQYDEVCFKEVRMMPVQYSEQDVELFHALTGSQ